MKEIKSYEAEYYAPRPGKFVLFLRQCVPFQLYRFIVINLKMMKLVSKSEHH